jgi:Uma2 family endonuclease
MSTITARLTAEQFARQYMDVPLRELVRGEVSELMPGGYRPGRISGTAFFLLESWARQSGLGRAVTNETGLITERGPDTVRGADVAYFSFQRLPAGREPPGFSEVPPNLVVEVLGKGQGWNVMLDKVAEYLGMGVDRVWIIDPRAETIHLYGGSPQPTILRGAEIVREETILPGFSCRVAEFFEDIQPGSALM